MTEPAYPVARAAAFRVHRHFELLATPQTPLADRSLRSARLRSQNRAPRRIIASEPIEGSLATVIEPAQLGGTRHISAAQFTHDQRDALAMVASQDGRFTLFGWSPCEEMVHARRVEALLL